MDNFKVGDSLMMQREGAGLEGGPAEDVVRSACTENGKTLDCAQDLRA